MLILPSGLDASGHPSVDLREQPTIVDTASIIFIVPALGSEISCTIFLYILIASSGFL